MRIAAMQPYFLPYLGYFALIKHTDRWVVNGIVQFRKHSWINRNRILSPVKGWNYMTIPLKKHSSHDRIVDITIHNQQQWKTKIRAQLQHYKKIAPHYHHVMELVSNILSIQTSSLMEMDIHSLALVCQYLDISFQPVLFTDLDINTSNIQSPDQWGLETAMALGADEYWNLPGGESFYHPEKYEQNGIKLRFLRVKLKEYDQHRSPFEPALSIVDAMMFNSNAEIHHMLDDYQLETISHEPQAK